MQGCGAGNEPDEVGLAAGPALPDVALRNIMPLVFNPRSDPLDMKPDAFKPGVPDPDEGALSGGLDEQIRDGFAAQSGFKIEMGALGNGLFQALLALLPSAGVGLLVHGMGLAFES